MVLPGGELRLIDFDGMFTPGMEGFPAPELGTPEFRHTRRDKGFFNEHIDDYPLALISVSLHALAAFPKLHAERCGGENLIFHPEELIRGTCTLVNRLKDHWVCEGMNDLYRLTSLLSSRSPAIEGLRSIFAALSQAPIPRAEGELDITRRDGFYGFGNIIAPIYDDAAPFSEGLAAVRIMKRRFYIDTRGRKVIDGKGLEDTGSFREGLAAVRKGGKYGYIDTVGNMVVAPMFDQAHAFGEGVAAVGSGGKYGFIDRGGGYRIAPRFDSAEDFRSGVAVVCEGGKYGYIDPDGNYLVEPVFDFASGFRGGRAVAEKGGDKYVLTQNDKTIAYERLLGKDNT